MQYLIDWLLMFWTPPSALYDLSWWPVFIKETRVLGENHQFLTGKLAILVNKIGGDQLVTESIAGIKKNFIGLMSSLPKIHGYNNAFEYFVLITTSMLELSSPQSRPIFFDVDITDWDCLSNSYLTWVTLPTTWRPVSVNLSGILIFT